MRHRISVPGRGKRLSLLLNIQTSCKAHLTSYSVGDESSFTRQLRYEADKSPPSSADVKNEWSCTSDSSYVFTEWSLSKHGDNFTFFLVSITLKISMFIRMHVYMHAVNLPLSESNSIETKYQTLILKHGIYIT
jgi:hypothetical protein